MCRFYHLDSLWFQKNADPDPDQDLCLNEDPMRIYPQPGQNFLSQKLDFDMKIIYVGNMS